MLRYQTLFARPQLAVRKVAPMALTAMAFALAPFSGASASTVFINFEAFPGPDGQLGTADDVPISAPTLFGSQSEQVTSQYASLGIEFLPSPGVDDLSEILDDGTFTRTAGSSPNLLSSNRTSFDFGPIEGRFTVPVFSLSMALGLGSPGSASPNVLRVFGSGGNLLGSVTGSDEFVSLSTLEPIASFRVTGLTSGAQAAIDDVRFTVVPEPTAASLVAFVAIGAGHLRRLRRFEGRSDFQTRLA